MFWRHKIAMNCEMVKDLASNLDVPGSRTSRQKQKKTAKQDDMLPKLEKMLSKLLAKFAKDLASKLKDQGTDSDSDSTSDSDSDSDAEDEDDTPDSEAQGAGTKEYSKHLELFKATLDGNWDSANLIFDRDKSALTAPINTNLDTSLHIAIDAGESHVTFVQNLVEKMTVEHLKVKNDCGDTPLSGAAIVGNLAAAKAIVTKNPDLCYVSNNRKYLPVHEAGAYAHKETLLYLRGVTDARRAPFPYTGQSGVRHLIDLLVNEIYDTALTLIKDHPELATTEVEGFDSPLTIMSKKPLAFRSGSRYGLLKRMIYSVIQVKPKEGSPEPNNRDTGIQVDAERGTPEPNNRDTGIQVDAERRTPDHNNRENVNAGSWIQKVGSNAGSCFQWLLLMPSKVGLWLTKDIRHTKLVHYEALEVVKCLCEAIKSSGDTATQDRCTVDPITEAAISGIPEVIEEILDAMPDALWSTSKKLFIFQLAVVNRCEKVFNLVYQMGGHKQHILSRKDKKANNILHLAGRLAPSHKLNLVSGAALQMQRELQWYKEVEKFVANDEKQELNASGMTPAMVFSKQHKHLVIAGEKWMKDTATSCSIAAALTVTIMFAAAITIPDGVDQQGAPIFTLTTYSNYFTSRMQSPSSHPRRLC